MVYKILLYTLLDGIMECSTGGKLDFRHQGNGLCLLDGAGL